MSQELIPCIFLVPPIHKVLSAGEDKYINLVFHLWVKYLTSTNSKENSWVVNAYLRCLQQSKEQHSQILIPHPELFFPGHSA